MQAGPCRVLSLEGFRRINNRLFVIVGLPAEYYLAGRPRWRRIRASQSLPTTMAGSVLLPSLPWQKQAAIEPLWRIAAGRRGASASGGSGGRRRHRRDAHVQAAATDSSTATEPHSKQRHRSKTAKTTQNGASAAAASEQAAMVLAGAGVAGAK